MVGTRRVYFLITKGAVFLHLPVEYMKTKRRSNFQQRLKKAEALFGTARIPEFALPYSVTAEQFAQLLFNEWLAMPLIFS